MTPEPHMIVADPGGVCAERQCGRPAVALTVRGTLPTCETHLRESLMWVEKAHNGREYVVSWALHPR